MGIFSAEQRRNQTTNTRMIVLMTTTATTSVNRRRCNGLGTVGTDTYQSPRLTSSTKTVHAPITGLSALSSLTGGPALYLSLMLW